MDFALPGLNVPYNTSLYKNYGKPPQSLFTALKEIILSFCAMTTLANQW